MHRPPLFLSFLSLVFSLLGATTVLTIVLAVTAGGGQHTIEQDYLRVTVYWAAPGRPGDHDCTLLAASGAVRPWTFPPVHPEGEGREPVSVFYLSPAPAGSWRLRRDKAEPTALRVVVETKRGPRPFTGFAHGSPLTIETRE